LVPVGSLSASAGLATALVLLAFTARRRRRPVAVLLVAAANAPWVLSGFLHASTATSEAGGAAVFALHGEGGVPGPVAALGLGGIWNAEVVPDSHFGALGWAWVAIVLTLAALGCRSWLRRTERRDRVAYVLCWAVGFGLALLTWATPEALGWVIDRVPGAGVVRDGSRLLVLCAPLLVALVAEGAAIVWAHRPPVRAARAALGVALVLAPVAVLPDAAWGLASSLSPVEYPAAYDEARAAVSDAVTDGSDVVLLPFTSYRQPDWNHHRKVLDPLGRYLAPDYVASDVLVVSGTRLSGEDPRVTLVAAALREPSPSARSSALGAIGVGAVAVDREAPGDPPLVAGQVILDDPRLTVVRLPRGEPRDVSTAWAVVMGGAWILFLGCLGGGLLLTLLRAWSVATATRRPV
jgi:hypothetical protein